MALCPSCFRQTDKQFGSTCTCRLSCLDLGHRTTAQNNNLIRVCQQSYQLQLILDYLSSVELEMDHLLTDKQPYTTRDPQIAGNMSYAGAACTCIYYKNKYFLDTTNLEPLMFMRCVNPEFLIFIHRCNFCILNVKYKCVKYTFSERK